VFGTGCFAQPALRIYAMVSSGDGSSHTDIGHPERAKVPAKLVGVGWQPPASVEGVGTWTSASPSCEWRRERRLQRASASGWAKPCGVGNGSRAVETNHPQLGQRTRTAGGVRFW